MRVVSSVIGEDRGLRKEASVIGEDRGLRKEASVIGDCLLYTSPSPRDYAASRMPSSA